MAERTVDDHSARGRYTPSPDGFTEGPGWVGWFTARGKKRARMNEAPRLRDVPLQNGDFGLSEQWMARAAAVLYTGGGLVAFAWAFLPDRKGSGGATITVMSALALVAGLVMLFGAMDKAPGWVFHVVVAAVQVDISITFVATATPSSANSLFYIWATTYAWLLFDRRAAVVQTVWTGICVAVSLWAMQSELFVGVRVWLMIMTTCVATGLLVGIVADRMRRSQRELGYAARHDPLTGLANRACFAEAVSRAARHRSVHGGAVHVLVVDLDHFKLMNDSYGHEAGDEILRVAASRLTAAVGPTDVVARMGGDEFAIVCAFRHGSGELSALLGRLDRGWEEPIAVEAATISLSATIGVATAGDLNPAHLLRWADVALYHAKETERGSVVFFDDSLRAVVDRRSRLEQALRHAVQRNELSVHYQPIVDLNGGRTVYAEALLRWDADSLGKVTPDEFIPIAEDTGLIVPIGEWVLDAVAAQVARWRRDGVVDECFRVSVNVSVRQLTAGFASRVLRTLAEYDLPLSAIALEITESVVLDDSRRFGLVLAELRESRIRLILDDFGKGYSSITYLQELPLHALKIDRAFVAELPSSQTNVCLVTAIIAMAAGLGMEVVAEGIETEEQATMLRGLGVQWAQGYLFGRPMPAAGFLQALGALAYPEGRPGVAPRLGGR